MKDHTGNALVQGNLADTINCIQAVLRRLQQSDTDMQDEFADFGQYLVLQNCIQALEEELQRCGPALIRLPGGNDSMKDQ